MTATTVAMRERARAENFPVAPRWLAGGALPHLQALYAFARLVDDTGDEPGGDRTPELEQLRRGLDAALAHRPAPEVLVRMAASVEVCKLSQEPLDQLIEANLLDQRVRRYTTFAELLEYCRLSANPVGRVVLEIFRVATPRRQALSDDICTALQILEHLQDVREDLLVRDRVYLPATDLEHFGCTVADLARQPASLPVRRLVHAQARRATALLDRGSPLVGTLHGRPRALIAGFVGGARAGFAALRAAGYDVSAGAPSAARRQIGAAAALAWGRGR